ncbi:hypothetical protein QFZ98_008256 [Paraburkholderia youngii]
MHVRQICGERDGDGYAFAAKQLKDREDRIMEDVSP